MPLAFRSGAALLAAAALLLCVDPGAALAAPGGLGQLPGALGCLKETTGEGCTAPTLGLTSPAGAVLSPDGKNLYVASSGNSITIYDRDAGTGALTQKAGSAGCIRHNGGLGCATGRHLFQPL